MKKAILFFSFFCFVLNLKSQNEIVYGCTNTESINYNQLANIDDGSCLMEQFYIDSLTSLYSILSNQYNVVQNVFDEMSYQYEDFDFDENIYGQIPVDLHSGWNMIGYNLIQERNIQEEFHYISNDVMIIKDNFGSVFWPNFNYDGIGLLTPGQGYQIKMYNENTIIFGDN